MPMLKMIDQSAYQKAFWTAAALKINGIKVTAIKVTEGVNYESPYYRWQLQQARLAGCAVLHYHLAHPEANGAHAEIGWYFSKVRPQPGDLLMLDAEPQIYGQIPATAASAWTRQWSDAVEARFRALPVIYAAGSTIGDGALDSVRGKNPLFYAYPGANIDHPPAPPQPWLVSFLQYGVNPHWAAPAGTDLDVAYFASLKQLADLAIPPAKVTFTGTATDTVTGAKATRTGTFQVTRI